MPEDLSLYLKQVSHVVKLPHKTPAGLQECRACLQASSGCCSFPENPSEGKMLSTQGSHREAELARETTVASFVG